MKNRIIDEFLPQEVLTEFQNDIISTSFPFFIQNKVNNLEEYICVDDVCVGFK